MPYIEKENRKAFEKQIDALVDKLYPLECGVSVGNVNYVISSIIWRLWERNPSYTLGNNLIGALECVKQEFYRRKLSPYEDKKMEANGDVIS